MYVVCVCFMFCDYLERTAQLNNSMYMLCQKMKLPVYENRSFDFIASAAIVLLMFNHIRSCFLFLFIIFKNFLFRQQPSLPANQGMRPIQSPRPYTTYELDQIRQFQKRLDYFKLPNKNKNLRFFSQQFSNEFSGGAADVYATIRQCGGSHTMTLPFKRQIKTQ